VIADRHTTIAELELSIAAALEGVGASRLVVVGTEAHRGAADGLRFRVSDGSWYGGLAVTVAFAPAELTLLAPGWCVAVPGQLQRAARDMVVDCAWISAPVGASAQRPSRRDRRRASWATATNGAPPPGPGSLIRTSAFAGCTSSLESRSLSVAAPALLAAGWSAAASPTPMVLAQRDRSAAADTALDIETRVDRLRGWWRTAAPRRAVPTSRLAGIRQLCRDVQGALWFGLCVMSCGLVATTAATGVDADLARSAAAAVGSSLLLALASACAGMPSVGPALAAGSIDASLRSLVAATRARHAVSCVRRPTALASTAAVVIEAGLLVYAARASSVAHVDATSVALVLTAAAALAPLLSVLKIVIRRPLRRNSGRVPFRALARLDGVAVDCVDLSLDGIGVRAAAGTVSDHAAQLEVTVAGSSWEAPVRIVRRDPQPDGRVAFGMTFDRARMSPTSVRQLLGCWLGALDAATLDVPAGAALPVADRARAFATAPLRSPVRFGGNRLLRAGTVVALVAVAVTAVPNAPGSLAAPPDATETAGFDPSQSWWVRTIVGANLAFGDGGPATSASIGNPMGGTFDDAGNYFVVDRSHHAIRRIAPDGTITRVGGTGVSGFSGDGGPATAARFNYPSDVAWRDGELFVTDSSNNRVRRIAADGTVTTVLGNGTCAAATTGSAATFSSVCTPRGIDLTADGRVVITAESSHQVVRLEPDRTVTVLAGNGTGGFAGDGGPATSAQLSAPRDLAVAPDGSIVLIDYTNQRIRRIGADGVIDTIAGTGVAGFSGDGGPATAARINNAFGLDVRADGTVLVADNGNHRVRSISPAGVMSTAAGTGTAASGGDGGAASAATVNSPGAVTVAPDGSWLILEFGGNVIRRVSAAGTISRMAGNASLGITRVASDTAGTSFPLPYDVEVGADGSAYVAGVTDHMVRRVWPDGTVTVVAGTGTAGSTGDGGPATAAGLNQPRALALGSDGSLYIAECVGARVRRVSPAGIITTVAGTGTAGFLGDGGPATAARLNCPHGLAVAADGTLYITDLFNNRVRRVSPTGIITTFAGTGTAGFLGDGGPATAARINNTRNIALGPDGSLYLADYSNHRVRRIAPDGTITTVAGTGGASNTGDGGPATSAGVNGPAGVAVDDEGVLWIATVSTIRRVAANGTITTVAGGGSTGIYGDGMPATAAQFWQPFGIDLTPAGVPVWVDANTGQLQTLVPAPAAPTNVVVTSVTTRSATVAWDPAPTGLFPVVGYRVTTPTGTRTVSTTQATVGGLQPGLSYSIGVQALIGFGTTAATTVTATTSVDPTAPVQLPITAVAGPGVLPDGPVAAASAFVSNPLKMTEDPAGNVYVSSALHQVWRIGTDGVAQVIAGDGPSGRGIAGYSGDGGPARGARLNTPEGLAWSNGVLYVADVGNQRVRAITADGTITTVAGTGVYVSNGDGGAATAAGLSSPYALEVDNQGRLLIGERARVRRIESDGTITTIAGNGTATTAGDGGPATTASINLPIDIEALSDGTLLIAEHYAGRVRKVAPDGTITTVAGTSSGTPAGDGGPATSAVLTSPRDLTVLPDGSILIADWSGFQLRRIAPDGTIATVGGNRYNFMADTGLPVAPNRPLAVTAVMARPDGTVLLGEYSHTRVLALGADLTTLTPFAGAGAEPAAGDGGRAIDAVIGHANSVVLAADGSLLVASSSTRRIHRVALDGTISTVLGGGTAPITDGARATDIWLQSGVSAFAAAPDGSFIATMAGRLLRVDAAGRVWTIAGTGVPEPQRGIDGDGGPATAATVNNVAGAAIAPDGSIWFSDLDVPAIRRIHPDGTISTVIGTGVRGFNGDGRPARQTMITWAQQILFDTEGRAIFSDRYNHRIRRLEHDGTVTTIAGTGIAGSSADGLPADQSQLNEPIGMAWDGPDLIVADFNNARIRRILPDGTMTTAVGTTTRADGGFGPAATTSIVYPTWVGVLPSGSIVWADWPERYVRAVPVVPATPTGIDVVAAVDGTAVLDVDTTVATGERLVVTVDPPATVTVSGTRVELSGLAPGRPYAVQVARADRFATSGTISANVTSIGRPSVGAPTVSNETTNAATITATVSANGSDVTGLDIRVTGASTGARVTSVSPRTIGATSSEQITLVLAGLQTDTDYEVTIEATNARGVTASAPIAFRTQSAPPPSIPSAPTATTPVAPVVPLAPVVTGSEPDDPDRIPAVPSSVGPPTDAPSLDLPGVTSATSPRSSPASAGSRPVNGAPIPTATSVVAPAPAPSMSTPTTGDDAERARPAVPSSVAAGGPNPFSIVEDVQSDGTSVFHLSADGLVPGSEVVVTADDGTVVVEGIVDDNGAIQLNLPDLDVRRLGELTAHAELVDSQRVSFALAPLEIQVVRIEAPANSTDTDESALPPWWALALGGGIAVLLLDVWRRRKPALDDHAEPSRA
jgi:hypothetical protein